MDTENPNINTNTNTNNPINLINRNNPNNNTSKTNSENEEFSNQYTLKILTVVICLLITGLFNNLHTKAFTSKVTCFNDFLFNLTVPINNYLRHHRTINSIILILGGLLEDITVILACILFCFHFKSWRLILALITVYALRMAVQFTYTMSTPEGILFFYPGFPSLFVPYLLTNDFFFSGHVSLPLVVGLEFYENKMNVFAYISFCASIYEAFMMLFIKGHYSIDMMGGYLFSLWAFKVTKLYIKRIDESYFGMDYKGVEEGSSKNCKNGKESKDKKNINVSYVDVDLMNNNNMDKDKDMNIANDNNEKDKELY